MTRSRIVGDSAARRAVDIGTAGVLLVIAAPILVLVAIAIRLESRGPALFSQTRIGKDERPFTVLKFRSMVRDAAAVGGAVGGPDDPRITRVGRIIRGLKIDELPQLINVLRGDMTLIGPRAEVPKFVPYYTEEERQILSVRPGLTSPGALLFSEHQAAELDRAADPESHYIDHQLHEKLAMDLDYLRRRSVFDDVRVVWRTFAYLMTRLRG